MVFVVVVVVVVADGDSLVTKDGDAQEAVDLLPLAIAPLLLLQLGLSGVLHIIGVVVASVLISVMLSLGCC